MKNDERDYLINWQKKYRDDLTGNILPFWLERGIDKKNGGIYTCLDREGVIYDTTKSVWFQGRAAYIFSYAYNNIEKKEEYLEAALSCIDFSEKHCYDSDGRMYFEVTAEGVPLRKRRYLFSECFATIALAEFAKATNKQEYAKKAFNLYNRIIVHLDKGDLEPKYLPAMSSIGHSITMILINTASILRNVTDDPSLTERIDSQIELLKKFIHPEYKALLETVTPDGKLIDTILGRTINPGHCIETSWFLMDEAKYRGLSSSKGQEILELALKILDWSWDWGWDKEDGGIINFKDCKGFPAQDYSQDMKFWWPQTEAIIATLLAYELTGNEKYLEMHKLVNDWSYSHLPDKEFPEWYGYLHKDGTVAQPAKGNLFKGPFHIPRMMIKSNLVIENILKK